LHSDAKIGFLEIINYDLFSFAEATENALDYGLLIMNYFPSHG